MSGGRATGVGRLAGVGVDTGANFHLGVIFAIDTGHAVIRMIGEADDDIGIILK